MAKKTKKCKKKAVTSRYKGKSKRVQSRSVVGTVKDGKRTLKVMRMNLKGRSEPFYYVKRGRK